MNKGSGGLLPRFPIYFVIDFSSQVAPVWREAVGEGIKSFRAKLRRDPATNEVVWLGRIYYNDSGTTHYELKSVDSEEKNYKSNLDAGKLRAALKGLHKALDREVSTGMRADETKRTNRPRRKPDAPQTQDWTPLVFLLIGSELADHCASQTRDLKEHPSSPNIIGIRTAQVSEEALKRITTVERVILLRQVSKQGMIEVFDWLFQRIKIACSHRGKISEALREVMEPAASAQTAPQPPEVGNAEHTAEVMPRDALPQERYTLEPAALADKAVQMPEALGGDQTNGGHGQEATTELSPAGSDRIAAPALPTPARWKEVEPTDKDDPVPHYYQKLITGESGWRIVGASRRGKAHAHEGKYREDAFAFGMENGWHIAAIADGAGAYPLSRVGANRAVESAVEAMSVELTDPAMKDASPEDQARFALRRGFEQAYQAVSEEAERRKEPLRNLATTLGLLLHRPGEQGDVVAIVHVGDSPLAGLFEGQQNEIFSEADSGMYAGQSLFLTSQGILEECPDRIRVIARGAPRMLVLMTDGVANDFYPYNKHLRQLFDSLAGVCQKENCDAALMDWLGYEKRGSFDDRTVIVLFRQE